MAGTARTGNTKNTSLWQGADVFIAEVGTDGPTDVTTEWAEAWKLVGLLDGEEGFTEERDQDTNEYYAWGGILYRRTSSKHKRTFKFVAIEDNDVVFDLVNPGSDRAHANGLINSTVKVPVTKRFAVGMEVRDGDRCKRRIIGQAEVSEVGEIKESEEDPTVYEITVMVFPSADGTLYDTIETDPNYSAEEHQTADPEETTEPTEPTGDPEPGTGGTE